MKIQRCSNCNFFRDKKCMKKEDQPPRSYFMTCKDWQPDETTTYIEKKKRYADEMVELWIKEDAPEEVKNVFWDALIKDDFMIDV